MTNMNNVVEIYIRVASMRALASYLVWLNGIGVTVDADWLDIDEARLGAELRKTGGGINLSGLYPCPTWLEEILRVERNVENAIFIAARKAGSK